MPEVWKDVAAGTVGGVAICAVGHPFDTLKVRLQTQGSATTAVGGAAPQQTLLYRNTWDCLVKTLR
jgi:solute carrier family 25 carnitine/acylcarnitine transporter 20/29